MNSYYVLKNQAKYFASIDRINADESKGTQSSPLPVKYPLLKGEEYAMNKEKFPGIDATAFQYPLDIQAITTLNKLKGIDSLTLRVTLHVALLIALISKIFIFGSYAKNEANEESDLDLCFISSKFKNLTEAEAYLRTKIYFILKQNIAVNVVAYRPEDFEETVPLVYEITRHGKEIKW